MSHLLNQNQGDLMMDTRQIPAAAAAVDAVPVINKSTKNIQSHWGNWGPSITRF